jgi:protein TonB
MAAMPAEDPLSGYPSGRRRFTNSLIASFVLHGVALGGGLIWLRPWLIEARGTRLSASLFVEDPREPAFGDPEPEREPVREPLEDPLLATSQPELFEPALGEEPAPVPHPDGEWLVARMVRSSGALVPKPSQPTPPESVELPVIEPAPQSEVALDPVPEPKVTATAVVPIDNASPKYPRVAVRLGQEGTVLVKMRVAVDGTVAEAWVSESSGYERLDQAALDAVADWLFRPATENGRPVESEHSHRLTFQLTSG